MNTRDLPEKWEREAEELRQEVERVRQGSGWWAHYARQADKLEQCAAELRAALPEQPLSRKWWGEAEKHDRAANNMASPLEGGIQARVLRQCAADLDAQHDEGRVLLREVMQEYKGRCACPENYGKHLEKRCVWCRIRKHLEGDSGV